MPGSKELSEGWDDPPITTLATDTRRVGERYGKGVGKNPGNNDPCIWAAHTIQRSLYYLWLAQQCHPLFAQKSESLNAFNILLACTIPQSDPTLSLFFFHTFPSTLMISTKLQELLVSAMKTS
jgi:hypothetical protein